MSDIAGKTILATFFHAPDRHAVEVLEETVIAIAADGQIEAVIRPGAVGYDTAHESADLTLPDGCYVLPGFVDCHVHAPQYPQLGQALDVPLEVWLQQYTFPLEARYADLDFARRSYSTLVEDLLASGTTTALYFATIHQEATRLLADICLEKGQRALVGKVVMDNAESCPPYYRDTSAEAAIANTRAFIDYVRAHPGNAAARVLPVVTPRFIPSCTDEALAGLGQLVAECGCHVQTHCSESDWAHGYVLDRHGVTDAESLDRFGLLTRRSVLAHSNFLSDADMDRVVARGAGVAHCALSNAYFANSVFPLRAALERGMHVGLGTDISGGPSGSLFEAARMTIAASRMLESGVDPALPAASRGRPDSRIDFATAFHLATAGGGVLLDLPIGQFAPGFRFDAMVIDTCPRDGGIRLLAQSSQEDILQKIVHTANRANITRVWVDGRSVSSR
ncbi:guanine deaminase [Paradevosia shaoguanensis]|uniref:Guanine deaminase n=1 Tax=Paradevosia shaoguanensis TaxID=1335043 RepID=A0AA41QQ32_9HYPH|nr:guanine deaminase [Paradevosia shaoguanensis]MCF1744045.1 guanine deaminase [Paradevosia shaoguanensis]MCI0128528.1 guanine deaminase [Paradevosia shaoguanensis]